MPSLGVLERVLTDAQESYRFRAGSIDTKAGLTLGAVGVVVALIGATPSVAGLVGQVFAITAGVLCVLALRPRTGPALNPAKLRDSYLTEDSTTTRLQYLTVGIDEWQKDDARLKKKNEQFQAATVMLVLAVAAVIAGAVASVATG